MAKLGLKVPGALLNQQPRLLRLVALGRIGPIRLSINSMVLPIHAVAERSWEDHSPDLQLLGCVQHGQEPLHLLEELLIQILALDLSL